MMGCCAGMGGRGAGSAESVRAAFAAITAAACDMRCPQSAAVVVIAWLSGVSPASRRALP